MNLKLYFIMYHDTRWYKHASFHDLLRFPELTLIANSQALYLKIIKLVKQVLSTCMCGPFQQKTPWDKQRVRKEKTSNDLMLLNCVFFFLFHNNLLNVWGNFYLQTTNQVYNNNSLYYYLLFSYYLFTAIVKHWGANATNLKLLDKQCH